MPKSTNYYPIALDPWEVAGILTGQTTAIYRPIPVDYDHRLYSDGSANIGGAIVKRGTRLWVRERFSLSHQLYWGWGLSYEPLLPEGESRHTFGPLWLIDRPDIYDWIERHKNTRYVSYNRFKLQPSQIMPEWASRMCIRVKSIRAYKPEHVTEAMAGRLGMRRTVTQFILPFSRPPAYRQVTALDYFIDHWDRSTEKTKNTYLWLIGF